MLKTQITGAKYLSPQTNQMTNLNIAVPADSKDTEFGTSDILLAKDVVAYLNALDSDISNELDAQTDKINKINESIKQLIDHNLIKIVTELPTTDIDKNCIYLVPNKDGEGNNVFIEYIYVESKNTFEEVGRIQAKVDLSDYYTKEETDNLILIAKNSAINIHNENNTKSIKLDINDAEAVDKYESAVNASLFDNDNNATINISATDGFRHIYEGNESNLYSSGLDISGAGYNTYISSDGVYINNEEFSGNIGISVNNNQPDGSPINISLTDGAYNADIDLEKGFTHRTDEGFVSTLNGNALRIVDTGGFNLSADYSSININDEKYARYIYIGRFDTLNCLLIGSDEKFKISRPTDNTEGATIKGVKSLTAFANPSATKVWATDGSTVDLTTKANTSDVLLKKSASGGYYIEKYSNNLGYKAFAANNLCTASNNYSFAQGSNSKALGSCAHAEGYGTTANDSHAHAEGYYTLAKNVDSHAEGNYTKASGLYAHALGTYNVDDKNAIHSVGIGNSTTRKNAEYIYVKNDTDGTSQIDDPKNGYKYLIGVGGYDGISTDNSTYKSVQEVIADLTARIEQLETKVRALEAANTPA